MFGRPERLAILILGLLAPAPYNTILFAIACALCLVSTAQVLSSGTARKAVKQAPLANIRKW
jgi:hypothetical protein